MDVQPPTTDSTGGVEVQVDDSNQSPEGDDGSRRLAEELADLDAELASLDVELAAAEERRDPVWKNKNGTVRERRQLRYPDGD